MGPPPLHVEQSHYTNVYPRAFPQLFCYIASHISRSELYFQFSGGVWIPKNFLMSFYC